MGIRKLKIWIIFLLAIVVVGFMLFQQSQNNKVQLDNQAIRNLEMVKTKFFSFYNTFLAEQEDKYIRYLITENKTGQAIPNDWEKFALGFKSITREQYKDFKALETKDTANSSLQVIFKNGKYTIKKDGHPVGLEFFQESREGFVDPQKNLPNISLQIQLDNALSLSSDHEFFEKILLADENGEILYPSSESGKKLTQLIDTGDELPINRSEILHQDQMYFMYYTPFLLEGKKFILAGLISKTHFESLGLRVDFSYLALLLFLLALMIFSLPIISFFGFRQGDVLSRFKVFSVGFSILGFMLLIGFGLAFLQDHHPLTFDDHSDHQHQISEEIETQIIQNKELLDNPNCCEGLKEFLTVDSLGRMRTLMLGISELPGKGSFINLANREYFNFFSEELIAKENQVGSEDQVFIGSHYSRIKGKLETVISKIDKNENEVHAVTFDWEEISPLSKKHRFILVKENGDVIFKSEMVKAPFDNLSQLLSHEKWLLLKSIMQSNSNVSEEVWGLSLYVDGYSYKLNLQKANITNFDQSIWLIYLQDEHLEHSFSLLVVLEVLVFLAGYLFVLILLSAVRWSIRPKPTCGLWEDFTYNYLFPSKANQQNYLILIALFLLQMLIMLGLYHNPKVSVFTLYFSALCFLILSNQLNFIFLEMNWNRQIAISVVEERNSRFYAIKFLCITSLIMILLAIVLNGAMRNPFSAYIIVILLILFSFICFLLKILFDQYFKNFEKNNAVSWLNQKIPWLQINHLYAWFFVVWITLIGFFPGFMLFSKTFIHEKELWHNKSESLEANSDDSFNWTSEYGKWRRNLFTTIPVREEGELLEFISPPKANVDHLIQNKLDRNPDFLAFAKNGYRVFKGANVLIAVSIAFLIFFIWLIYWLNKTIAQKLFFAGGINPKLGETITEVQYRLLGKNDCGQTKVNENDTCKFIFLHRLISDQNIALVADLLQVERGEILSYDGKLFDVLDNFAPSESEKLKVELTSKNIILIENLHCIADSSKLLERLSSLMKFCKDNQVTLVLVTGVSWKHLLSKIPDEKDKLYYSEIFSPFVFAYIPIKSKDFKGNFVRVSKIIDENEVMKNDLETKLLLRQRFFKADYTNIWAELSTEEKKVTYEFAVHEFLNYAAAPVIVELIQKGVLVFESGKDRFTLFSDTFRYFILLHISREEKNSFRNIEIRNGNSDSIQIAVFSFVLLSVALISYFDKSFLDQATSYVTGIIGTLGGLYSAFRSKFWKNSEVSS